MPLSYPENWAASDGYMAQQTYSGTAYRNKSASGSAGQGGAGDTAGYYMGADYALPKSWERMKVGSSMYIVDKDRKELRCERCLRIAKVPEGAFMTECENCEATEQLKKAKQVENSKPATVKQVPLKVTGLSVLALLGFAAYKIINKNK